MLSNQSSSLAGIDPRKVPFRRISSRLVSVLDPRSSSKKYSTMKVNAPTNKIKIVEIENIIRVQILSVLSALKKKKVRSKPNNP
jgi:hypothetical protein